MARILRGDIYWADLNPTIGSEQASLRPILILSQDVFNHHSATVIAMAITSVKQKAGYPLSHELSNTDLPKKSWVKMSQIRTLSVKRLTHFITRVDSKELKIIIDGLNEIISN